MTNPETIITLGVVTVIGYDSLFFKGLADHGSECEA